MVINADSFLFSNEYLNFTRYKHIGSVIKKLINDGIPSLLSSVSIDKFVSLNSEYFETYILVGKLYEMNLYFSNAIAFYEKSLTKVFEKITDRDNIIKKIKQLRHRTNS